MANKFISDAAVETQLVSTLEMAPIRGTVVKSKWLRNLLIFLSVVGPGLRSIDRSTTPPGFSFSCRTGWNPTSASAIRKYSSSRESSTLHCLQHGTVGRLFGNGSSSRHLGTT